MTKRELIESVLGVELFEVEIELLKIDWKAFYVNPEKYKGTIVVELIREYLGVHR